VPKDVTIESLGQFEDMRNAMMKKMDIQEHTAAYARYVAIYLQKIRDGHYDPAKVEEVQEEVKSFPACEVIAVGQFFFLKLYSLSTGTAKTSQIIPPTPTKSKQDLTTSKRNSASMRPSTKSHGR